jgi:phosphoserine phosphatase
MTDPGTAELMAEWMKQQMILNEEQVKFNDWTRMRLEMLEAHNENLIERVYEWTRMRLEMLEAHNENLIERVYELEQK